MSTWKRWSVGMIVGLSLVGIAAAQVTKKKGAAFRELFLDLDTNRDGAVDREEVPAAGRAAFDRLLKRGDENHDGKLQALEYRTLLLDLGAFVEQAKKQRTKRFKSMDGDRDGKLSRKEFTSGKARFDALDRDSDGFVSREEFFSPTPADGKATVKKKAAKPATPPKKKSSGLVKTTGD